MPAMKAAIVAVGDELLAPGRVETNSVFVTDRLALAGIPVGFRAVVRDDERALAALTASVLEGHELVFLTGGLGPTSDDLTRDAVARALGREMSIREDIVDSIRARFEKRGMTMPPVNRKQAMVLDGAEVLENRRGTAPGLWVPEGDKAVVLLPGPPAELQPMFNEHIVPRLAGFATETVYAVQKLWLSGLPESSVEEKIGATYRDVDNPSTTILAGGGRVEIRLTATGATLEAATATNERLASRLRELLGDAVFSEKEEPLEEVIGQLLMKLGWRVSVAESLTGGLIADRLTDVPGASAYFDEGVITYSNDAKTARVGVPSELFESVGAVSSEVASAMAVGAREQARADVALAVTGIAGPTGGSDDKPVGLVYVGLATADEVRVERFEFPGTRKQIKRWTSQAALNLLRLELMKRDAGFFSRLSSTTRCAAGSRVFPAS